MTKEDRRARLVRAGQWLRDQRQRRGFATAADFARAVKIDKTLVSNYETGRSEVPDDRAEQIAKALSMDLIDVRRGLGLWVPPPDDGRTAEELADEMERTLLRIEKAIEARADDRERPLGEAAINVLRAILE